MKNLIFISLLAVVALGNTAFAGPLPGGPQQVSLAINTLPAGTATTTTCELNGLVSSTIGGPDVWFMYGLNGNLNLTSNSLSYGNGSNQFTITVTGLTPAKTYTYKAYAMVNGSTTAASTTQTCTTSALPISTLSVSTLSYNSVTTNSFVANGMVIVLNTTANNLKFIYGTSSTNLNQTQSVNGSLTSTGPITATISGLTPDTDYYYKACATKLGAIAPTCGTATQLVHTLPQVIPVSSMTVTTLSASNIDTDSAILNGDISLTNESAINRKFMWGGSQNSLYNTLSVSGTQTSDGTFSSTLTGLNDDTDYFYKACATQNSNGNLVCSTTIKSFHTDPLSQNFTLTVDTDSANADEDSARLYGSFDSSNGDVTSYFNWGTTSSVTHTTNDINEGTESGTMDAYITGLNDDTKYYYQACGEVNGTTDCGSVKSFYTDAEDNDNNDEYECNDGDDNDGDGYEDYPEDPACSSSHDDDESPYNNHVNPNPCVIYGYGSSYCPNPNPVPPIIKYVYINNGVTTTDPSTQFLDLSISTPTGNVYNNDTVQFTISYGNISRYAALKNVTIDVRLPNDLAFLHSQSGIYDSMMNVLTIDLGTLSPLENGRFVFDARVNNISASNNLNVEATGKYMVNNDSKEIRATVMLYSAEPDSDYNSQSASAIFGDGSFLPNTFMGWVVMLAILFGIIYLGRKMYKKETPIHSVAHH